jgi:SAM-dependent methyltransferase
MTAGTASSAVVAPRSAGAGSGSAGAAPGTAVAAPRPAAAVAPPSPAETYETYFGPAIFGPLAELTVALAAPRAGEYALDVACGTGIVTRRLAGAVGAAGRAVGLDRNPAMLEIARTREPDGGATIEWQHADLITAELPVAAFDVVTCQQGLQFIEDRAAAVRQLRSTLAPEGRAVVAVWRDLAWHPLYRALSEAELPHLQAHGVEVGWEELTAPFSLGDAAVLRGLFADGGFGEVTIAPAEIEARFPDADDFVARMEHAYAAVVPAFASDPAAFTAYLEAVGEATHELVAEHRDGDHVAVPMHTYLVHARP